MLDRFVLDELSGRNPGVVHQSVEPAQLGGRVIHCLCPLRRIADVQMHIAGGLAEFVGKPLAVVVEEIGDHHLAAPSHDVAAERGTEPARTAGDEDDLAGQLSGIHVTTSPFRVQYLARADAKAPFPHQNWVLLRLLAISWRTCRCRKAWPRS